MSPFWSYTKEKVFEELKSSPRGLTHDEASARLRRYGRNAIRSSTHVSAVKLFLLQFKSPITILLIVTAGLSFVLSDPVNAIIILLIVLVSSILGWWQEKGAVHAMEQLLKIVQTKSNVIRGSAEIEVLAEEIVPGDIVKLNAGDIIPGDGLIIESDELFVDEATFTGETFPVEKNVGVVSGDATLSQRSNFLFMGSHVVSGKSTVLITATGASSEFGRIADRLKSRTPETDFEKGIRKFGNLLLEITLLLVVIIFAVNVLLHKPVIDSLLFSLALAVGLTPQLLPAIISVNLSTGARKMAADKVIVKKLSAIENLGSMNILCSDKTGTITEGNVKVKGTISVSGDHSDRVLKAAWINASLQQGFANPIDQAIVAFGSFEKQKLELVTEVPYDFIRKRLTIVASDGNNNVAYTKGAFVKILEVCSRVELADGTIVTLDEMRSSLESEFDRLSNDGLRVLGVCYKDCDRDHMFTRADELEMTFLGFVTLFDPPKPDVANVITDLRNAGVQLKIITGDNRQVSRRLALNIGIDNPVVMTGQEIQQMSDRALVNRALAAHVFAEVEPNQKEKIILSLKKAGNIIGFMGDGINDTTAMHSADVSISVDTAVDVAKATADIILLERDLSVLKKGIEEGRKTFGNTLKYVFMATSANFGNMISMALASVFLPFLPLLPKQILLTNLLTDLPEMTISSDRVDQEIIDKPYRWNISFIRQFMVTFGLLSSVFDLITFYLLYRVLNSEAGLFQTGWFVESVISASLVVLVIRTRRSVIQSPPGKPLLFVTLGVITFVMLIPLTSVTEWFGFQPLSLKYLYYIVPVIIVYVISAEWLKRWFYRRWPLKPVTMAEM